MHRLAVRERQGTGVERQEHERAGLLLGMPGLNRANGGLVADQHGVHPVTQEPLGQLGVFATGAEKVAQRTEHAAVEAVSRREERRRRGGQSNTVALELLERVTTGGELSDSLFHLTTLGPVPRLALPRLRHEVSGVLGLARCAPSLVAEEAGALDGMIPAPLGAAELLLQCGAVGFGLRGTFPQ
jgi:hypothetical protein